MNRLAAGTLAIVALAAPACDEAPPRDETREPLRPLLYTESPARTAPVVAGFEEWTRPDVDPVAWPSTFDTSDPNLPPGPATSPHALLLNTYRALVEHRTPELDALVFDPAGYASLARASDETARERTRALRDALGSLAEGTFAPPAPSMGRDGGLAGQLVAGSITLGAPRRADGQPTQGDEAPVLYLQSRIGFRWEGTPVAFSLLVPRMGRDLDGVWHLLAAPTPDAAFEAYRRAGLDLNPALMRSDHASFPLSVGSYWHYRVTRPGPPREPKDDEGDLLAPPVEGFRDEVEDIADHGAYRVVRMLRSPDDPADPPSRHAWLVTPLHLYRCDRECQNRARDPRWMLAWIRRETPAITLPARPDRSWGPSGRTDGTPVVRVQRDPVPMELPAGTYAATLEHVRNIPSGRESLFVVPSVGIVARRISTRAETRLEELTDYRVMPQ